MYAPPPGILFRRRLRPLARGLLTLLTAAWLMLALQPCAMAMAMDDCEQCPPSDTGLAVQAGCLSSASCAARQDWQQTVPTGITLPVPSLLPALAWYEAPPAAARAAALPTPVFIVPPLSQRFDRLRI